MKDFDIFCKVFGKVVENSDNLVISIPLWRVKEAPRDTYRFRKIGIDGKEEKYYGPSDLVAFADLEAVNQISSFISKFYSDPVQFKLDNDKNFKIFGKTIIVIGSTVSNSLTRKILNSNKHLPFCFEEQEETLEHPAALCIKDNKSKILYDCSWEWQYSMVMRIPNKPMGYFFIVAGPHAEGTLGAALFLKSNWKKFENAQSIAAILLEMPRGKSDFRVVKKIGF
ncbi:MAG: hypothetical protein GF329_18830 [Candidatus Lokiarchaeota archaeon]|nr:hypothetical protein [Candidatus Lokiarchaeota archaeon]